MQAKFLENMKNEECQTCQIGKRGFKKVQDPSFQKLFFVSCSFFLKRKDFVSFFKKKGEREEG